MIAKRVEAMNQLALGRNLTTRKTRKRQFLEEMERVVPWPVLVSIVEPYSPKSRTGRPPFAIETMLRIHYLQQWFVGLRLVLGSVRCRRQQSVDNKFKTKRRFVKTLSLPVPMISRMLSGVTAGE